MIDRLAAIADIVPPMPVAPPPALPWWQGPWGVALCLALVLLVCAGGLAWWRSRAQRRALRCLRRLNSYSTQETRRAAPSVSCPLGGPDAQRQVWGRTQETRRAASRQSRLAFVPSKPALAGLEPRHSAPSVSCPLGGPGAQRQVWGPSDRSAQGGAAATSDLPALASAALLCARQGCVDLRQLPQAWQQHIDALRYQANPDPAVWPGVLAALAQALRQRAWQRAQFWRAALPGSLSVAVLHGSEASTHSLRLDVGAAPAPRQGEASAATPGASPSSTPRPSPQSKSTSAPEDRS